MDTRSDLATPEKCINCTRPHGRPFCALENKELNALDSIATSARYSQGTVLFREGDEGKAVYILCGGRVKLSVTSQEGRTMILKIAQPGDLLAWAPPSVPRLMKSARKPWTFATSKSLNDPIFSTSFIARPRPASTQPSAPRRSTGRRSKKPAALVCLPHRRDASPGSSLNGVRQESAAGKDISASPCRSRMRSSPALPLPPGRPSRAHWRSSSGMA